MPIAPVLCPMHPPLRSLGGTKKGRVVGGNAAPRCGVPDQPIFERGDKKEIALARAWGHHTLPEGSPLYTTALCTLWNIYPY
jgi:hypothetical protein